MIRIKQKLFHILILALLLAMLVVPVVGTAVNTLLTDDGPQSTSFEVIDTNATPAAVIACSGGSEGGNSGC